MDHATLPPRLKGDFDALARELSLGGLRGALAFLNRRTPHRYTGVFRFDGDMLRNVALVDKWDSSVLKGDDVPIATAYCAHLQRTGLPLEVEDGDADPRVPWMHGSPIVSYCGAVIKDPQGEPWGALCHFDSARCDSRASDMPLLLAAATVLYSDSLTATERNAA